MAYTLSILIPVYNAEKNLPSLLDAILPLKKACVEVIALDDGSADGSLSVLRRYRQRYPEQLKVLARENKGVVLSRRELYAAATGEWVWMIDSDDGIPDHSLDPLLRSIEQTDADMIVFDYFYADKRRTVRVHTLPYPDGTVFCGEKKKELYRELIARSGFNSLWSKVCRRACVDTDVDYTPFAKVRNGEDKLQLLPMLTRAGKVLYIRKPFYTYVISKTSMKHTIGAEYIPTRLFLWQRLDAYLDIWDVREELGPLYAARAAETVCDIAKYAVTETGANADALADTFTSRVLPCAFVQNSFLSVPEAALPRRVRHLFRLLKAHRYKRAVREIRFRYAAAKLRGRAHALLQRIKGD